MGDKELDERIVVKTSNIRRKHNINKPLIVKKISPSKTLRIEISNFDPRKIRIEKLEAPVLQERGFKSIDETMTTWRGKYKGYPAQIVFSSEYPAVPFQWYWDEVPNGFGNVIDNQLCIEALLDNNAWTPEMTVETVFEGLDSHPYFRK
jgi:hypothetical protein